MGQMQNPQAPALADFNNSLTKTALAVTAGTNVVIDVNKSYICGEYVVLSVKGHATSNISNNTFFTFNGLPTAKTKQAGAVFGVPYGGEWSVEGVNYGYIGDKQILGHMSSGKYFHVLITLQLDR